MNQTEKRFPAEIVEDKLTFLNDKNIDAELYAFFQSLSDREYNKDENIYYSYVRKKDIPTQKSICEVLGLGSPKTYRSHFNYLISQGYIVKEDNGDYFLPNQEAFYMLIPYDTLTYLLDNCQDHVIKIYIYLGTKYRMALNEGKQYEFCLEELGKNTGLKVKNNSRGYEIINHALELLANSGLITYRSYFDGQKQVKKLTKFSFEYKKQNG